MELPGHVGAALLAYAPIALATTARWSPTLAFVGAGVVVVLAPLPDVDERVSRLAHRGAVHTVWFALAVGVVVAGTFAAAGDVRTGITSATLAAFGFLVGTTAILSHVIVDGLTPMGIAPFAPISRRRYSLNVTLSADSTANRRFLLAGVATAAIAFGLGWILR